MGSIPSSRQVHDLYLGSSLNLASLLRVLCIRVPLWGPLKGTLISRTSHLAILQSLFG